MAFSINLILAANVDDAYGSLAEAIAEIMPALIEEFGLDETGIKLIISLIENQVRDHSSIHSRRNCSYLFQTVVLNNCGCTPRGVWGVKRPEIL